jgi:hypothetical protein
MNLLVHLIIARAGKDLWRWPRDPRLSQAAELVYKLLVSSRLIRALLSLVALMSFSGWMRFTSPSEVAIPTFNYVNDNQPKVPWSIHVIRVPRQSSEFNLCSVHAAESALGLSTVSEQTALSPAILGVPVAAINGDFYQRESEYAGDVRGLQIVDGELLSAPADTPSFWIDAMDEPHTAITHSLLQVIWQNGLAMPMELNRYRNTNMVVLYTSALGISTHTSNGLELLLEWSGHGPWLPLRPNRSYQARVTAIRYDGDSPILPGTVVLSVGPSASGMLPCVQTGDEITFATFMQPNLRGVKTAISGGPILVRNGRRQRIRNPGSDAYEFTSMQERHPRSAIGWNTAHYFLVNVDGRQTNYSVGMTLEELSTCLLKLGCQEAMNLDGGGSATLWYEGKVRNRPCDGSERPVANSLVVLRKK